MQKQTYDSDSAGWVMVMGGGGGEDAETRTTSCAVTLFFRRRRRVALIIIIRGPSVRVLRRHSMVLPHLVWREHLCRRRCIARERGAAVCEEGVEQRADTAVRSVLDLTLAVVVVFIACIALVLVREPRRVLLEQPTRLVGRLGGAERARGKPEAGLAQTATGERGSRAPGGGRLLQASR